MEKKNVVFLSIIAVATLLTAVVGATFAYFSIGVGGTGNASNNQTVVKTAVIAGVNYEGSQVASATDAYPGWKGVQIFTIKLPEGTDPNAKGHYTIKLTPNVPTEFGSDITYELYKTTTPESENITRKEGTLTNSAGQVSKEDTITYTGFTENTSAVKTGTLTGSEAITLEDIDYTGSLQDTTYYLVYKYANTGTAQDSTMGKTFTATVNVELSVPEN